MVFYRPYCVVKATWLLNHSSWLETCFHRRTLLVPITAWSSHCIRCKILDVRAFNRAFLAAWCVGSFRVIMNLCCIVQMATFPSTSGWFFLSSAVITEGVLFPFSLQKSQSGLMLVLHGHLGLPFYFSGTTSCGSDAATISRFQFVWVEQAKYSAVRRREFLI